MRGLADELCPGMFSRAHCHGARAALAGLINIHEGRRAGRLRSRALIGRYDNRFQNVLHSALFVDCIGGVWFWFDGGFES